MIYEFAVDPEQVARWAENRRDYRDAVQSFALGEPRVVSEYPRLKVWKRQVLRSVSDDDMALQRATALMDQLTERVVRRCCDSWDGERCWLENTLADHQRCKFSLIISQPNGVVAPDVLEGDALWNCDDPRWLLTRGVVVRREGVEIARVLAPLLSNASEIVFVDPWFNPTKPRFVQAFGACFRAIVTNRGGALPRRVQLLTSMKKGQTSDHYADKCQDKLPRRIPVGLQVGIRRLSKLDDSQSLHNRYVLTEIGGVKFGHGLDEGSTDGDTDDVNILSQEQYATRWRQYGCYIPEEGEESEILLTGQAPCRL